MNLKIKEAIDMLYEYNLCNIDDDDVSISLNCNSKAKISAEFNKKKALTVIDKLAKYIKISPQYTEWNIFMNTHKADKVLDASIKEYILAKNIAEIPVTVTKLSSGIGKHIKPKEHKKDIPSLFQVQNVIKSIEEQQLLVKKRITVIKKKP